jgi:endonuclease G
MKILSTVSLVLISLVGLSQVKPNAVIKNAAYTSYIDTTIEMPVYVEYRLYRGGGPCERANRWTNDSKYQLVGESSYSNSGYERGHLANAEDFAYNCHLDSLTFMYYNRLPQTKSLNRGVWKKQETLIRSLSQKDSLWIICGGYWDSNVKIIKGLYVPTRCWKLVYSLTTGKLISGYIYTNDETAVMYSTSKENLESLLGYKLISPTVNKKKIKTKK